MVSTARLLCSFRTTLLGSLLLSTASWAHASDSLKAESDRLKDDTHPQLSYELMYIPGKTLAMDTYVKEFIKKQANHSLLFEVQYRPTDPATAMPDDNTFDSHYNYPILSGGLRYNFNHGTTMHRDADQDWGNLQPVDYTTHLGDAITLYGKFTRPFFRHHRWEAAYYLGTGVGYAWHKYNRRDAIDNELVGAHLSIYFAGGLGISYQLDRQWRLHGGLDFAHHSNGALHRPNKGANYFGPSIGLIYTPETSEQARQQSLAKDGDTSLAKDENAGRAPRITPFRKYWFAEATLGFGGKSLLEEWDRTQDELPPTDPDYRTEHFRIYPAYSLQLALMNRYSLCYATGLALDLCYGSYSNDVARLDEAAGHEVKHSPWSAALAVKQNFYYGQFTLRGSFGYYLYRRMGVSADEVEKPYYERIGLAYAFKKLGNISVGFNVKAHLGKADFTELEVVVPVKLSK